MPQRDIARCRRASLVCVCIGVGAITAASLAVPTSVGGLSESDASPRTRERCPFAHATPGQARARSLGAALRCLVNRHRRRHHIARLADARVLDRIARRSAEDMRNRGYFGHTSPDGRGLRDRVHSAGMRSVGEVIAWGCGNLSSPAATVRQWLASPLHRRMVLSRRYTVIGAGVTNGAAGRACGPGASTSVALLGRPR